MWQELSAEVDQLPSTRYQTWTFHS
ncbi:hypothetical protein LINPERHAP2_LOCUS37573 [Linum perenne]